MTHTVMNENLIALVGPEIEENLSLRYLAAALEQVGFETEIVPFDSENDFVSVLDTLLSKPVPPMMVALSLAFQWRAIEFLSLAVKLREGGYRNHITTGGHFGTFAHKEILRDFPEVDTVCLYEAETTIVQLAKAVQRGTSIDYIEGLAFQHHNTAVSNPPSVETDLTRLPWPKRRDSVAPLFGHRLASLVGSRGCYARCAFCCISAWHRVPKTYRPFRLRPVEDVADEMVWLKKEHGRDIFNFQDDNFFMPGKRKSLERLNALADALAARHIGAFATVVKARPNDLNDDIVQVLKNRLNVIRLFIGVETHAVQGLETLNRCVVPKQNEAALALLKKWDIYPCFNLLVFDPDTTCESLAANLCFTEKYPELPHSLSRVELYAGTPILSRMQAENRVSGDYLGSDYRLASTEMETIFELTTNLLFERNFGDALVNRMQGLRIVTEAARHFHPDKYRPDWRETLERASRTLMLDSVSAIRKIMAFAKSNPNVAEKKGFEQCLRPRLKACEQEVTLGIDAVEQAIDNADGSWASGVH